MGQNDMVKKKYRVHVTETITNFGIVEVEAYSQREAEEVAEDQFDSSEHDDGRVEWETFILAENGIPVEWCEETESKNRDNPYRLCPERRNATTQKLARLPW